MWGVLPLDQLNLSQDELEFWEGAQRGQLLLRQCTECARFSHPPGPMCRGCGAMSWRSHQSTGRGTVHSWIASRAPTETADVEDARIIVLVDLDEGVRLVSNLVGVPITAIRNGMAVQLSFGISGDIRVPQFIAGSGS